MTGAGYSQNPGIYNAAVLYLIDFKFCRPGKAPGYFAAVVRNAYRRDRKRPYLHRNARLDIPPQLRVNLMTDGIIAVYAVVNRPRGIDGQTEFVAQRANAFHVVGMIVGYKYARSLHEREPHFVQKFLKSPRTKSNVDDKSLALGENHVTITAASAP